MKKFTGFLLILFALFSAACEKKDASHDLSILVFITGVLADNPYYELLAQGVQETAERHSNVKIKIYEAGANQSQWEQQLAEMISANEYDIVIGSNPNLPVICANVGKMFNDVKFIIIDADASAAASLIGNSRIRTYVYNQKEQSVILGYLAGLITISDMPYANSQKRVGFIAAQEYPILTEQMVPGFIEGAKLADPGIELDFRVIGSWEDAAKAAELTSAMISSGVDVFTSNAGHASQGIIKTAAERNKYMVWYNTDNYEAAPGIIVGCGMMEQKRLAMEIMEDILADRVEYGISQTLGIKEGYLGFIFDNPGYQNLPEKIKNEFEAFINEHY